MSVVPAAFHLYIWLTISITSWSACVLQIYALYRFHSMQHLLIINKRYPMLVIIEAAVAIFMELIVLPLETNSLFPVFHNQYLYYLGLAFISPCTHFVANMEACRLWLIGYNLHFLYVSQNERWKTQINRHFGDHENWYLCNKNTFGNPKYVVSRGFAYYLFAACISTTFILLLLPRGHTHLYQFIDGTLFCVPVCCIMYTYWTCRKHHTLNDNLMFHYEFKTTTFFFGTTLLLYFITTLIVFIGFGDTKLNWIFSLFLVMYGLSIPSLISTLWIPRKILSTETWHASHGHHLVNANGEKKKRQSSTLKEVMRDEQRFESLMGWMYRDFSFENILCFIEMVQFRQYCINMLKSQQQTDLEQHVQCEYTFYANMPKSSIVYGDAVNVDHHVDHEQPTTPTVPSGVEVEDQLSFDRVASLSRDAEQSEGQQIARKLYAKYVQSGAEFEVNISATLRTRYDALDEQDWKLELTQMVTVFDEVIEEVLQFIRQSYTRSQIGV